MEEDIDQELKQYCADNGIKIRKTILGKPQQNGVVERMNKTLNEHAKSMRLHIRLLKMFWAKVISTTTSLINRGILNTIELQNPRGGLER